VNRTLSFDEFLKVKVTGDPLTAGDIAHARKGVRLFPEKWMVVMLTEKGARLEMGLFNKRFKYRLDGYAPDGSDIS